MMCFGSDSRIREVDPPARPPQRKQRTARMRDGERALPRRYWHRNDEDRLDSRLGVPRNCPMTGRETAGLTVSKT
jgi:hypothetical protein